MSDPDLFRHSLDALSGFFIGDATLQETLTRVSSVAEEALPHAAMVAITMLVEGRPTTAVFTDAEAPDIDTAQYKNNSGPCLHAFRTNQVVRIDSTKTDDRWPDFASLAADHGVLSTLSLPLAVGNEPMGAMNFYARTESAFSETDEAVGTLFAKQASILLANSRVYWDTRELSDRLSQALTSRAVIDQAKGVLMAQSHVDPDTAFALLVRASQRENRKLRDIAKEIVDRAIQDPPLTDDPEGA